MYHLEHKHGERNIAMVPRGEGKLPESDDDEEEVDEDREEDRERPEDVAGDKELSGENEV